MANCGNDPEALAVLGVMIEEGDENEAFDDLLHGNYFSISIYSRLNYF